MVAGINWSSYTASQIVELKQSGVDVPENVYNEAYAEVTAQSDDSQDVSYVITDDASEINEAEQEIQNAEDYGATLKDILGSLISQCQNKDTQMSDVSNEINKYSSLMDNIEQNAENVAENVSNDCEEAQINAEQAAQKIKEKEEEINATQAEIEQNQAEIESGNLDATAQADKESKITELQGKIETLGSEIQELQDVITSQQDKEAYAKQEAESKLNDIGKTMEDVKNDTTKAMNDATNANEYADAAIKKGTEATQIDSRKDARKAGFSKFFGLIGSKKDAHELGEEAIAAGNALGGSTVNIGNTAKEIGQKYNISFAETSNISSLTSKEYVQVEVDNNIFAKNQQTKA